MTAAAESPEILIIANCVNFSVTSNNSATLSLWAALRKLRRLAALTIFSNCELHQRHSYCQCKYWLFDLQPIEKLN